MFSISYLRCRIHIGFVKKVCLLLPFLLIGITSIKGFILFIFIFFILFLLFLLLLFFFLSGLGTSTSYLLSIAILDTLGGNHGFVLGNCTPQSLDISFVSLTITSVPGQMAEITIHIPKWRCCYLHP